MTYDQAHKLATTRQAEMRHPNIAKGYIIVAEAGKLISHNPLNGEKTDYEPTEDDLARTDWMAGYGLALL